MRLCDGKGTRHVAKNRGVGCNKHRLKGVNVRHNHISLISSDLRAQSSLGAGHGREPGRRVPFGFALQCATPTVTTQCRV